MLILLLKPSRLLLLNYIEAEKNKKKISVSITSQSTLLQMNA